MGKITVSIDASLQPLIDAGVRAHENADVSGYIEDLIRQDQEATQKLNELRVAIQEGIDSGVSDRTVEQIWDEARRRHRTRHG